MQQAQKAAPTQELETNGADNVLPLRAEARAPLSVASIYLIGDGTLENPLQLNVPALTAAIVNSMTTANFLAIKNGLASCEGVRSATGSIGP